MSPRVEALIADLDTARAELKKLVRGKDPKVLAKRPPSGEWSVVENVRHLIFAEQIHLGRYLPEPVVYSAYGLAKGTDFPEIGTKPTKDIEVLLREWDRVHRPIRKALQAAGGDVEYRLKRHVKHLRNHIVMIGRTLRKVGG